MNLIYLFFYRKSNEKSIIKIKFIQKTLEPILLLKKTLFLCKTYNNQNLILFK